jgi:hypothetical protein
MPAPSRWHGTHPWMVKPCRSVAAGGIVKAEGLGDGPGHRQSAVAKLRRLRLTMPPIIFDWREYYVWACAFFRFEGTRP